MTVSEFIRRIQQKVQMLSSADIPIKYNGQDMDCVIELIENGEGYYINIKQSHKDQTLTCKDIKFIVQIFHKVVAESDDITSDEAYCETLKRFNEQREKKL